MSVPSVAPAHGWLKPTRAALRGAEATIPNGWEAADTVGEEGMTLRCRKATMIAAAMMFSTVTAAQAQVTGDPVTVDGGQISGKWRANASVRA